MLEPARRISMMAVLQADGVVELHNLDLKRHAVRDVRSNHGFEEGPVVLGVIPDLGDHESAIHRAGGVGAEAGVALRACLKT